MINEDSLQEFKCALSTKPHYLVQPITLNNCGHSVCKSCLPNSKITVKCITCCVETEIDLSKIKVSKATQQALQFCFEYIFDILERDMSAKLNELKGNLNLRKHEEFLEKKFREIDFRVESIKSDAEESGERLKAKVKLMFKGQKKFNSEREINYYSNGLKELQSIIKSKTLNANNLEKMQVKMNNLKELIFRINDVSLPEIAISNSTLLENIIAKVYFHDKNANVVDLFKNGKKYFYNKDAYPSYIDVLPNNQIIFANYANRSLTVHDKNFRVVKTIQKIKEEHFSPTAIQVNSKHNNIYICDSLNCRILMIDTNFHFIKSVGSKGTEVNQFNEPLDIFYKNDSLYISDKQNKRVQIYSESLDFVKSIKLDYKPWSIKATNFIICVGNQNLKQICFYNFNDFSFIRSFKHGLNRVSQIDSFFYEFDHQNKLVYCYDENAILKEKITLKGIDDIETDSRDGAFIEYNGTIIMQFYTQKKIIKFSNDEL